MFSFFGVVGLLFFVFVRPQNFNATLQAIPLIYIFTGVALFGMAVDLRLRLMRPQWTPQMGWSIALFAWAVLSAVIKGRDPARSIFELAILFTWYFLISYGVQGIRGFRALVWVLLGLSIYLSAVGIHQHFSPKQCIAAIPVEDIYVQRDGKPDGRPCQEIRQCYGAGAEPGMLYGCERVGVFETMTLTGRVRYVGIIGDPNELALTVGVTLPFLLALFRLRPNAGRAITAVALAAAICACIYFTRSRGGQLVVAAVLSAYLVRRFGVRGLIVGGIAAALLWVAVVMQRSADAGESTMHRIGHMYEGFLMLKSNPLAGVGFDQFTEHHWMTAHNAYILVLAELGFIGFFLWVGVLYNTARVPLAAVRRYRNSAAAGEVRHWAMSLLASLAGMYIGVFFLSFSYHYMLWCYQGLSGALYRAIRMHDESFSIRSRLRDWAVITGLTLGISVGLYAIVAKFMSAGGG